MEKSLENHSVNDEIIKQMTENWIQYNGGDYKKRFIENKLLYGFKNEELNLENMMIVSNWIKEIENAENYIEAYNKFSMFLGERYGSEFLKEHNIGKATPIIAKMMYEQDMRYQEIDEHLLDERFKSKIGKLGLAQLYLIYGTVYLSQFGLVPTILGVSANILLDIGFALRELCIPIFIEEKESENIINLYVKKLIYAYKTENLDRGVLKLELYNLVNLLDKNYGKEDCNKVKQMN